MRHHLEHSCGRLRNAFGHDREFVLVVSVGAAIDVSDHVHRGVRTFTESVRMSDPLRRKHPELLAPHANRSALDPAGGGGPRDR